MNRLPLETQVRVISALCEGNSVRGTGRLTGVAKGTILRLIERVGFACAVYHDRTVRNVNARRVQADELWCFVGSRRRTFRPRFAAFRAEATTTHGRP